MPDDRISRRENDLLEEIAKREHQILAERITALNQTVLNQGIRLDVEFGKAWKFNIRVLKKLKRMHKHMGLEMTGIEDEDESDD
jgi:hypothetical protein